MSTATPVKLTHLHVNQQVAILHCLNEVLSADPDWHEKWRAEVAQAIASLTPPIILINATTENVLEAIRENERAIDAEIAARASSMPCPSRSGVTFCELRAGHDGGHAHNYGETHVRWSG